MTQRVTKTFDETLHTLAVNWDALIVAGLFFASFALYAATAAPGVLDGDFGEFQTVIYNLGVTHTGYPLYFLLAKLWTLALPAGTIAYRANVFSGFLGALTLVLIYASMRTQTQRRSVALLTAVLFGLSRVQWSQAVIPDVYTLNSFFIVLVLWFALLWRAERIPLWWVSLAYGLALTHHRTILWLAPALALFVVWGAGKKLLQPRLWLTNGAALFLPLLLYLYIPLRGASDVGVEYHAQNFADMILASNVSVWLKFGPPGFIWERITQVYLPLLIEQFTIVGFALGWVGIAALAFQRAPRGFPGNVPPRQWLGLLLLAHLGETAFAIVFWVVDSEIFFIPSYLTFLFFVGIGLAVLCDALQTRLASKQRARVAQGALLVSVALVAAFLLWTNYARNDQSRNDAADARWQEILAEPLEKNAVLMGPWEDLTPFEYYAYVENMRRDLKRDKIVVYRDQLALVSQGDVAARVRAALQNGTAVYLTRYPADTETLDFSRLDLTPVASLWRVTLRNAARQLTLQQFDAADALRALHYLAAPRAGAFVTTVLNWAPDAPLEKIRLVWQLRDDTGNVWRAQETLPFGGRDMQDPQRDMQGIFIPPDAPPGKYRLELAAFARDSQEPQTLVGESNRVELTLDVGAAQTAAPPEVLRIPRPLQVNLNDAQFLGYGVSNIEPRGGDVIEFYTWWQGLTRGDGNFEIKFRNADGAETILYQGALFSSQAPFEPAQSVRARHTITLPPQTPAGFAKFLLTYNGQALPEIRLALDESQRVFHEPTLSHPQVVFVGDAIQLRGYQLERPLWRAGETIPLTLIWNATRAPSQNWKVFVHLTDANGVVRAQQDSIPQRGALPTTRWFPGEYIADPHALTLPNALPPGAYRLAVGMYDEATGARAPLFDAQRAPLPDNRVLLDTTIQVQP